MTQPHEIRAWLGDDWTDEQIERITHEYLQLERKHAPDAEEGEALLTAIAQRVDGTLDRGELRAHHLQAQISADEAKRALRAAVRVDIAAGMYEHEAAEAYGVARKTVRRWLGK